MADLERPSLSATSFVLRYLIIILGIVAVSVSICVVLL